MKKKGISMHLEKNDWSLSRDPPKPRTLEYLLLVPRKDMFLDLAFQILLFKSFFYLNPFFSYLNRWVSVDSHISFAFGVRFHFSLLIIFTRWCFVMCVWSLTSTRWLGGLFSLNQISTPRSTKWSSGPPTRFVWSPSSGNVLFLFNNFIFLRYLM